MTILLMTLLSWTCFGVPGAEAAEQGDPDTMMSIEEIRSSYRAMIPQAGMGEAVENVHDVVIPASEPVREIPLRIYTPLQAKKQSHLPLFLFLHGGGFVSGDLDTHDVLLRAVAQGAGCIVVSVGYRLAPEHPFPAGLEDAYAALLWSKANALSLGGDPAKIVVGGDSAGGNLAAAAAILARDRKGPELLGQWLMYPTVSNKMDTASWKKLGGEYFPTRDVHSAMLSAYIPQGKTPHEPLMAPLGAHLEHLPPALIQVGGLDPLSDECKEFAQKLKKSGNKAELLFYPEFQHGFLQFYQDEKTYPGAEHALEQGLSWLRERFAQAWGER